MSILIDTNIWIDLSQGGDRANVAMAAIVDETEFGPAIMSAVVWAELAAGTDEETDLERVYMGIPFRREVFPFAAAFPAGQAHRLYRQRGGRRQRTLPDFLIGAHAMVAGHRLLTRDPARYRSYFPDLDIVTPEGTT